MTIQTRYLVPYYLCRYSKLPYCAPRDSSSKSNVPQSKFHTSSSNKEEHAVLIGGGVAGQVASRIWRKHLSEISEHRDLSQAYDQLTEKYGVKPENIHVLFGNGDKTAPLLKSPLWHERVWSRVKGVETEEVMPELPSLKGAASMESLEAVCTELANKIERDDRVRIVVTGHGKRFMGTLLWNKYLTTNFLLPRDLKTLLEKFHASNKLQLYISSCYSGQYLSLTSKNITVFSSSSSRAVSQYMVGQGCLHLKKIFSDPSVPALKSHFDGALEQSNHFSSESLTYYIEKTFEKRVGDRKIEKFFDETVFQFNGPPLRYFLCISFGLFVLADPTRLLEKLYRYKFIAACGKASIPLIKALALICFKESFQKLETRFKKSQTYRKWFTKRDRKLIEKVDQFRKKRGNNPEFLSDDTKVVTHVQLPQRDLLEKLLSLTKEIKECHGKDKPLTSYYYLHDKVRLFLSLATPEEIEEFVEIAKELIHSKATRPKE